MPCEIIVLSGSKYQIAAWVSITTDIYEMSLGKLPHISRRAWTISSSVISMFRSSQIPSSPRSSSAHRSLGQGSPQKREPSSSFPERVLEAFAGLVVQWSWPKDLAEL